jgi:hypothetical protein
MAARRGRRNEEHLPAAQVQPKKRYFGRRAAREISANAPMVAIMRHSSTIFSMQASVAENLARTTQSRQDKFQSRAM